MTLKVSMTHVSTHLEGQKDSNAWGCCCVSDPQKGAEELKTTLCAKGSPPWSSLRKFPVDFKTAHHSLSRKKTPRFFFRLGNVWDKQLNKSQLVTDALGARVHVVFLSWQGGTGRTHVRSGEKKKDLCRCWLKLVCYQKICACLDRLGFSLLIRLSGLGMRRTRCECCLDVRQKWCITPWGGTAIYPCSLICLKRMKMHETWQLMDYFHFTFSHIKQIGNKNETKWSYWNFGSCSNKLPIGDQTRKRAITGFKNKITLSEENINTGEGSGCVSSHCQLTKSPTVKQRKILSGQINWYFLWARQNKLFYMCKPHI